MQYPTASTKIAARLYTRFHFDNQPAGHQIKNRASQGHEGVISSDCTYQPHIIEKLNIKRLFFVQNR